MATNGSATDDDVRRRFFPCVPSMHGYEAETAVDGEGGGFLSLARSTSAPDLSESVAAAAHPHAHAASSSLLFDVGHSPMVTALRSPVPDLYHRQTEHAMGEERAAARRRRRQRRRNLSVGDAEEASMVLCMDTTREGDERADDGDGDEERHRRRRSLALRGDNGERGTAGKKSSTLSTVSSSSSIYASTTPSPARNEDRNGNEAADGGEVGGAVGTSSSSSIVNELRREFASQSNCIHVSIIYGLINAAIVLPVLLSFGNIIYRDEAFRPYLPILVQLTVCSGVVHQVAFSTFSSLPFAVGQVQDAGLIFLSSMATSVVRTCRSRGSCDDEHMLATVTIGLGLSTALLGGALILLGRCRLAGLVQALPTSVVGGYLAYIGFFCGQAGLGLMAGTVVENPMEWYKFFWQGAWVKVLPGVVGGMAMYLLVRNIRHMAILPSCIAFLLGSFYVALAATGTSVQEARDAGWINDADAASGGGGEGGGGTLPWYHTWDYLRFDKVVWSILLNSSFALTLISMIFVVALSSSLDVAAIELDLGRPLDYNHELRTVGISNVLSGLTGGYTGSYIFSQSIFNLRAGVRSRLSGYVLALCEVVVVLSPVPILSYIPNCFFGSLLVMICVDLCWEWLWDIRSKVTAAEHGVALGTFVLIQLVGVEYGILVGIVLYAILAKAGADLGRGDSGDGTDERNKSIKEGCDAATMMLMQNENGGSLAMSMDYGSMAESCRSSSECQNGP